MVNTDRKLIKEAKVEEIDISYDDCVDLDDLVAKLTSIKETYQQTHTNFKVIISSSDEWTSGDITVYADRYETDEEYQKRIAKETREEEKKRVSEAKAKILKEERERKEYERLKKKFEVGSNEKEAPKET